MDNLSWDDGGDSDGSFEDCVKFSLDGISAPAGLQTAPAANAGNAPLAGIFSSTAGVILFYITKN
jgi:hypothetical protein